MESPSIPLDLIQLVPFQGLVEQSVAGIYIIQDEHFQYANATFAGMGGYKPEELIGRRLKDFVPLDFADEVMDRYNKRITGEVPSMRFTTRGLHKNGDVVYIEVHGQAMEFRGRPAVVGVGVNVTDHVLRDDQLRRSQSEYRQLAAYLNTMREEQRAEYAREVHDVLGGILTSIKLDVGRISRRPDSPEVRAIAADLNSLVSEAIDSVREISEAMRPQTLDHLGLGAAVATHLERFRERSGLRTTLTPPSFDVPLSRPRATAAFRIFQEALTNIARHAQASHVIVRFSSDRDSFSLEIVDDGCGMELHATSSSRPVRHALGLMTMRERAHQVGGTLTIESAPGKGTRVLLHAPLADNAFLPRMIKLLIIDDHAMFRAGLRKVFGDERDIEVVDEAGDWRDGLAKLERHAVDVLLLDINLPDRSGLEALDVIRVRFPALRTIVLSMYCEPQYAMRAMRSGACGYVAKDMEVDELVAAIRRVARGNRFVTPAIAASMLDTIDGETVSPHERLSPRESQILRMMVAGEALTAIGSHLVINVKTVSTYRRRILEKLGVASNAELVQYAVRHRLVD